MTITALKAFNSAAINRNFKVSPSAQERLKTLDGFSLFPYDGTGRKSHCCHQHLSGHDTAKRLTSKPAVNIVLLNVRVKS